MSAVGHSLRLAWIDVQRMVRKHTAWGSTSSSVIGVLMYAVLVVVGTIGGGYLGYLMGQDLPNLVELEAFAPIEIVRGILALFWVMLTLVITIRAVGQRGVLAQPEGVLTVVPTRQAFVGVLLAELVYVLMWLFVPAAGVGVGMAVGSGVWWPAVMVPLAVVVASVGSIAVAYPLGVSIRHTATRFEFVARHKTAIIVVVFLAYFGALASGAWDRLMVQLFEPLQSSPMGWYADVAFVGLPVLDASTVYAGGAIGVTVAVAVIAVVGGSWVVGRHWFSDPALAGAVEKPVAADAAEPGFERRLTPFMGRSTASFVVLSWRRAFRSPFKLLYALYPILLLMGVFADVFQTGEIPVYLPYAILLSSAWAAGVIFTLNPLGDQGAALPSTLLSRVDGRSFIRAHLLAGLLVAVPIGTVATAAIAYLSPLDVETTMLLVVGTPVILVVAAMLSVGIGVAFPRFEATTISKSMKTVLPSRWAFVIYTAHLFLTVAAAAIVTEPIVEDVATGFISWVLPFGWQVGEQAVFYAAAVVLVPLVVAPFWAYRFAIERYDHYTLG